MHGAAKYNYPGLFVSSMELIIKWIFLRWQGPALFRYIPNSRYKGRCHCALYYKGI